MTISTLHQAHVPGTTKRARRTKAEIAAAKAAVLKTETVKKEIEKEVEKCLKKGGKLLTVFAKEGSRRVPHRVLITKGGQVFFPEHGMVSLVPMLAEFDMRGKSNWENDFCFVLAIIMADRGEDGVQLTRVNELVISCRYHQRKDKIPKKAKKYWAQEASDFVDEIKERRGTRYRIGRESAGPVTRGLPFLRSLEVRLMPIINDKTLALKKKILRVSERARQKGKISHALNLYDL